MAELERARAMAGAAEACARDHLSWPASAGGFDAIYRSLITQRALEWQAQPQ
jgi:hypothetical protein